MLLAEMHEPLVRYANTSVTLTVAVAAFVIVALGWMSRAAYRQPGWSEHDLDGELPGDD